MSDIAGILADHQPTSKLLSPSDVRMACLCGHFAQGNELPTYHNDWIIAHQAKMLAAAGLGLAREAQAVAWDEGAGSAWERSNALVNGQNYRWRHAGEPINPYRAESVESQKP